MAFVLMLQSSMNFIVLCFLFCHDVIRSYNFHAGRVDTVVRVPKVEAHVVSGRQGVWLVFAPQELVWLATALLEKDQHTARDQAFESHAMRRNPPCWGSNGECPIALVVNLKRMTVWIRRPFVLNGNGVCPSLTMYYYGQECAILRGIKKFFCNATKSRKTRICSSFSELRTCSLAITSWLARDTRALPGPSC